MDLSIVIVSYRTPDHLRRCLETLRAMESSRSREVLVVDNDSGDESPDVVREFPEVKLIESGANLGFAGGVNRGLAEATGAFIMILNPDIEVKPGALDTLVDFLEAHPQTGIVGPKLLNTDGSVQYSCRRYYTFRTLLLRRTFLKRFFADSSTLRRHLMLDYDHASPRAVDWIVGAAMLVRREALEDVGPMDDRYFLYFEDVDWCTRMQARGWQVQYAPQSEMVHHWQRASASFGPAARRHLRSGLRFYERWGGLLHVMRQYRVVWRTSALVALDVIAVTVAFLLAYALRSQLAFILEKPVWPLRFYGPFLFTSALVFLGAFALHNLYRDVKEGDWVDVAFRVARGATTGALVVMASTFVLDMRGFSRLLMLGSWPLVGIFAFLGRRWLHGAFSRARRERLNLRRVALLGSDPVLDRLERAMNQDAEGGWEPVRIRRTPWNELPLAEGNELLLRRLAGERVNEAVVTPVSFGVPEGQLAERILLLRRAGIRVRVVSEFLSALPPRARLEAVGALSWLSLEQPVLRPAGFSKRVLDLTGGMVLGLVGLLPFTGLALARVLGGKKLLEPGEPFQGRWGESLRLRRLHGGGWLSGYPGLAEVLRGRFSLVGPRPLRPGEEVPGGEAWERVREHHRPGLVGPWTLAPAPSLEEEMQQELRYLETWSPEKDLKLLARVALRRSGGGRGRGSASTATPESSTTNSATPAALSHRGDFAGTESSC